MKFKLFLKLLVNNFKGFINVYYLFIKFNANRL